MPMSLKFRDYTTKYKSNNYMASKLLQPVDFRACSYKQQMILKIPSSFQIGTVCFFLCTYIYSHVDYLLLHSKCFYQEIWLFASLCDKSHMHMGVVRKKNKKEKKMFHSWD